MGVFIQLVECLNAVSVQHHTAQKISKCFISWISERREGVPLLPKEMQLLLW